MSMPKMAAYSPSSALPKLGRPQHRHLLLAALSALAYLLLSSQFLDWPPWPRPTPSPPPEQKKFILDRCRYARTLPAPPASFYTRAASDRFVSGTPPTLLKNATIWTGGRSGTEVVYGDVLLDKGMVQALGYVPQRLLKGVKGLVERDVGGAWVTPGIVDLHSHIGVGSSPDLRGASDTNSLKSPILPHLRSIDGLNTHDDSYELAIAGGVTTAQVLPGSANNIGGQAFVIKLRSTADRSVTSKVLEPPYTLNGSNFDHTLIPRWRHMKHACGENPSRVYSQTRMDSAWAFRSAYAKAQSIKLAQDAYCTAAESGRWSEVEGVEWPDELEWEALVDVVRGKVRLSVHCYEAVDLDGIVRLSNEFQFPVASFHHAGETYLVPDLLKKTWGGVPSIALFAANARKKREAYRGSEFAPRILASHNIPVVMKSDHPVLNSRYLLFEAQQAHFYGLDPALALSAVTATPARAMGMGHRIGAVKEGYDADIVVWDSHPLALGATPLQVYIDGIAQISNTSRVELKPPAFQHVPRVPDFDDEARRTVEYEGLPPLGPERKARKVVFEDVRAVWVRRAGEVEALFEHDLDVHGSVDRGTVVVRDGAIVCAGTPDECAPAIHAGDDGDEGAVVVDLKGGVLVPGLTTFGSPLGLVEIRLEPSTNDGRVYDPLSGKVPEVVGGEGAVIRAVDGLQFGGRNALLAYRAGVTTAISAPVGSGFLSGLSTSFALGAAHAVEEGAVLQKETALHVTIGRWLSPSVSTTIATFRRMLFSDSAGVEPASAWGRVRSGTIPLVVNVENADIMATLLKLKAEFDAKRASAGAALRLTFTGAAEAHLLAKEIGRAGVSVVLAPSRPFPEVWDQRRILPGPPLSYESAITTLLGHGVNVAIGVVDEYTARNTRFDIAWAALEAHGKLSKAQALALVTTNLEKALGYEADTKALGDLVAYRGGDVFDFESKPAGVVSSRRRTVDLF